MTYDTNECKELTNAISGYRMKMWGKDKIQEVLMKYNITNYMKYKESIHNLLNELFPISVTSNKPIEKPITQVITMQDEQNENDTTTEDVLSENKPRRKRKSRKKKVDLSNETVDHSESD